MVNECSQMPLWHIETDAWGALYNQRATAYIYFSHQKSYLDIDVKLKKKLPNRLYRNPIMPEQSVGLAVHQEISVEQDIYHGCCCFFVVFFFQVPKTQNIGRKPFRTPGGWRAEAYKRRAQTRKTATHHTRELNPKVEMDARAGNPPSVGHSPHFPLSLIDRAVAVTMRLPSEHHTPRRDACEPRSDCERASGSSLSDKKPTSLSVDVQWRSYSY